MVSTRAERSARPAVVAARQPRTTTPSATVYAYPWDVTDEAGADALASLGAGSVTLAAAYHAVRTVALRHPRRRLIESDRSRLYTRVPNAWRSPLPRPDDGVAVTGVPDAFERARDLLLDRGVAVRAWVVLNHVDRLGGAETHYRRNALGEPLRYALCPSQPEVRAHAAATIAAVLAAAEVPGVVLEAVGALSAHHASEHDKTALGPQEPDLTAALSFCFCHGCRSSLRHAGVDDQALARAVADRLLDGDAGGAVDLLSTDEVRRHTASVAERALVSAVSAAVRAGASDVSVHATALPGPGGPAVVVGDRLTPSATAAADGATLRLVASCWVDPAAARRRVRALATAAPGTSTGAFVDAVGGPATRSGAAEWRDLVAAGADELHVYHAGLAGPSRLREIREALDQLRRIASPTAKETIR